MNRSVLILPVMLLVAATFLFAADLSGTWAGREAPAGDGFVVERTTPASLIITQNGSVIEGTFTGSGASKPVKIESGRIGDDAKITFWLRDSGRFLVTAQLTVDGDWIRGRITTSAGHVMNIALRKQ